MSDSECTALLTAEYGQRVPPPLIAETVRAAWASSRLRGEATARADVAALAEAIGRSGAAGRAA